jgi:D-alanyl-D-alanine carboxypeptidase
MNMHRGRLAAFSLVIALAGCGPTSSGTETPASLELSASVEPSVALVGSASPSTPPEAFPTEVFAGLGDEPVSDALAADLQKVLDESAKGDGLTATLITPEGTWSGATGLAARDRAMVPNDQMSIAHITQTIVAAQVMQLVEAGELNLDDLAADRLPPGLGFDANGATIADLLSHRSGLADTLVGPGQWESLTTDPLHAWTIEEELATVGRKRTPAGQSWEFVGTNYLLLGLIIEQVTGRSVAEVLRSGVLEGNGYERLIFQPDERPTEPMAMPLGASADTFDEDGGSLPSLARVTAERAEANMASDSPSLARWFRALCAGQVVSPVSLDEMTDFEKRPEFGLGIWDRRYEYGYDSGALGLAGVVDEGYRTAALCLQDPGIVVVVLTNANEHDVDTTAGNLWRAASTR